MAAPDTTGASGKSPKSFFFFLTTAHPQALVCKQPVCFSPLSVSSGAQSKDSEGSGPGVVGTSGGSGDTYVLQDFLVGGRQDCKLRFRMVWGEAFPKRPELSGARLLGGKGRESEPGREKGAGPKPDPALARAGAALSQHVTLCMAACLPRTPSQALPSDREARSPAHHKNQCKPESGGCMGRRAALR